jgi:class 3 adenylate cyclase
MTAEQMRQQLVLYEQDRLLDSMAFTRLLDSMQLSQKDVVVQQQQAEIDRASAEIRLRNSQRNLLLAFACFVLLLAAGLFHRYFAIRQHNAVLAEKNRIIEEERRRSDELLLNILPVTVANELKEKGAAQARRYDEATVLFAGFKDFSQISKQLSPEKLVADLDFAFTNFDKIITKYGLEKIKTIGDAYMCAGGLPGRNNAHPIHVVQAALEMQEFLRWWNYEKMNQAEPLFEARMGIHTGPLVAGVVGSKKFAYDIWGDTVNVASRMESNSEAGRVNISDTTFELVKGQFNCEYRGKVPAKNVGEVDMYFVKGV